MPCSGGQGTDTRLGSPLHTLALGAYCVLLNGRGAADYLRKGVRGLLQWGALRACLTDEE